MNITFIEQTFSRILNINALFYIIINITFFIYALSVTLQPNAVTQMTINFTITHLWRRLLTNNHPRITHTYRFIVMNVAFFNFRFCSTPYNHSIFFIIMDMASTQRSTCRVKSFL